MSHRQCRYAARKTRPARLSALILAGILTLTAVGCSSGEEGGDTTTSNHQRGVDPTAQPLTFAIAEHVYNEHRSAATAEDSASYSNVTCAAYIDAATEERQASSVDDLLAAFREARGFVQAQKLDRITLLDVVSTSSASGTLSADAVITDNTSVPPRTDVQGIGVPLVYESGRWKLCPASDLLMVS